MPNQDRQSRPEELLRQIKSLSDRSNAIDDLLEQLIPRTLEDHIVQKRMGINASVEVLKLKAEKKSIGRLMTRLSNELAIAFHAASKPRNTVAITRGQKVYEAIMRLKSGRSGKGKTNDQLFKILAVKWNEIDVQAIRKAFYDYQKKTLAKKKPTSPTKSDPNDMTDQGGRGHTKSPE